MKSMDKHKICKICNRRFANGKAMGGHMRSHFSKHPIPPKPNNKYPSSSTSLSNIQTHHRSVNGGEFFDLDQDGSETELLLRNLTAKIGSNNKRPHNKTIAIVSSSSLSQPESVSSLITEDIFSSDDEVAMCLLKLSRDKWPLRKDKQVIAEEEEVDEHIKYESEYGDDDRDEDEDEDELCLVTRNDKYKCKTCKKVFRSYQALGGHKASHKKIKILHGSSSSFGGDVVTDQRMFECPFCDKVFDSGQALGGHKKIHLTYLTTPIPKISAQRSGGMLIDLNLPAPEDDCEVSQV